MSSAVKVSPLPMPTSKPSGKVRIYDWRLIKSVRFLIAILLMFGLFCSTSMRMNMSMAVVCMVNATAFDDTPDSANTSLSSNAGYNGELLWSSTQVSLVLSGTFYGALATVWWSGYLSDRFGAKVVLLSGILLGGLITLTIPLLTTVDYWAVFVGRLLMGLGEGTVFPGLSSMGARWFPPFERSTFASIYTAGNQMAGILSMSMSSQLCSSALGWQSIFYLFGGLTTVWAILWFILATNSPDDNRFISQDEVDYIRSASVGQHTNTSSGRLTTHAVPWVAIVTSTVVYSSILAQMSFHFSASLLQTYLPTYMRQILKVDLEHNGFYAMLPFLTQLISKFIFGPLADALKRYGVFTNTQTCKIFQLFGNIGGGTCFLVLALFANEDRLYVAVATLTLYGCFFSAGICGFYTSLLSIAPAFTGTIMSIGAFCGVIGNAASPTLVGLINVHGTRAEWRLIFIITAVFNYVAAAVYFLFGSAEIQEWAVPPEKRVNGGSPEVKVSSLI